MPHLKGPQTLQKASVVECDAFAANAAHRSSAAPPPPCWRNVLDLGRLSEETEHQAGSFPGLCFSFDGGGGDSLSGPPRLQGARGRRTCRIDHASLMRSEFKSQSKW